MQLYQPTIHTIRSIKSSSLDGYAWYIYIPGIYKHHVLVLKSRKKGKKSTAIWSTRECAIILQIGESDLEVTSVWYVNVLCVLILFYFLCLVLHILQCVTIIFEQKKNKLAEVYIHNTHIADATNIIRLPCFFLSSSSSSFLFIHIIISANAVERKKVGFTLWLHFSRHIQQLIVFVSLLAI